MSHQSPQTRINNLVSRAYSRLDILNSLTMTRYRDRLFRMCVEEEREHRRGRPSNWHPPKGATVQAAGRLFTVQYLVECILGKRFSVEDLIYIRPSVMYAQSVALNYQKEIREALSDMDLPELRRLDYCELMRTNT